MPVNMKSENIFVEFVFRRAIMHHEGCVDQVLSGGVRRGRSIDRIIAVSDKGYENAFGVGQLKVLGVVGTLRDRARLDAVSDKIAPHLGDVIRSKSNFSQPILARSRWRLFQLDVLLRPPTHREARSRFARATVGGWRKSQAVAVTLMRFFDVCCIEPDVVDAGTVRARDLVTPAQR